MDKIWKYPHDLYMSAKFRAFNTNLNNFACFRTIFLYYKGGEGVGGVGGPRNNNVQPRPVESAWIFLAGGGGGGGAGGGWSYLPQKSSTVLSEPKFGTPTKKSLGLPLVRGQNVLNNNFLTTVREQYVCMYVCTST